MSFLLQVWIMTRSLFPLFFVAAPWLALAQPPQSGLPSPLDRERSRERQERSVCGLDVMQVEGRGSPSRHDHGQLRVASPTMVPSLEHPHAIPGKGERPVHFCLDVFF
ncbi:hypothetical protein DNK44_22705 [Pseudomonas dryadis]|uniref:Uncharacterized protein n=2 Tax=Phytopseudomonas dryadis TaxID=2487520 RepID=A0A4Q9QTV4_9GAMM|nr:hypothetical protein DNK44_22705 [Pseudomonas dryadis]